MNTSTRTRTRLVSGLALAAVVTATVAATTTAAGNAAGSEGQRAEAAAAKNWKPLWHSEFGTPRSQWPNEWTKAPEAALSAWSVKDQIMVSPEMKSQARYLKGNVDQAAGNLVVTTRRVCAQTKPTSYTDFTWLAKSKPSVAKCSGDRRHPVYTSGRLQMENPAFQASGKDVRIDFRATLPGKPAAGTRQALWANNAQSYCAADATAPTNVGEVDALEWYGNAPRGSFSTTHMACRASGSDPGKTLRREHQDPVGPGTTHTWSVRKQGHSVTYYLDGKQVEEKAAKRPDTCGTAPFDVPTGADCNAIMDSPWMTIINGEVFKGKFDADKRQSGPRDGADFAAQKLKVDWVRTYTR